MTAVFNDYDVDAAPGSSTVTLTGNTGFSFVSGETTVVAIYSGLGASQSVSGLTIGGLTAARTDEYTGGGVNQEVSLWAVTGTFTTSTIVITHTATPFRTMAAAWNLGASMAHMAGNNDGAADPLALSSNTNSSDVAVGFGYINSASYTPGDATSTGFASKSFDVQVEGDRATAGFLQTSCSGGTPETFEIDSGAALNMDAGAVSIFRLNPPLDPPTGTYTLAGYAPSISVPAGGRDIPTDVASAIAGEPYAPLIFVEMEFNPGIFTGGSYLRVWNGLGQMTHMGDVYEGAGGLLGISNVDETTSVEAAGMNITLSGVFPELLALAVSEPFQGRRCTVRLGADGASTSAILFAGLINSMNITDEGGTAVIAVGVESELEMLNRPPTLLYTDANQKQRYPTDKAFEFVTELGNDTTFAGGTQKQLKSLFGKANKLANKYGLWG